MVGRLVAVAAVLGVLSSCSEWQTDPDGFTEQERALIKDMKAGVPLRDPSNAALDSAQAQRLGQALFFDPELSGPLARTETSQQVYLGTAGTPGRFACADCHTPTGFFDDTRSTPSNVSFGIDFTTRNSPTVVNVAFYTTSFAWDGRSDSLWMQCAIAHESKAAMGGTRPRLARRIAAKYAGAFEAAFPDAGLERISLDGGVDAVDLSGPGGTALAANAYKAMAAYLTQLISVNAPIDAYAAGDFAALSPSAKRGLKLFLGRAGCVECHKGSNFTDNDFHSVGVPQRGEHVPLADQGHFDGLAVQAASAFNRCGVFGPEQKPFDCPVRPATESDRGQFRTKSLRNVARTPPYMHAGQFQTLEEVVRFYNGGGETTGFVGTKSSKTVPLGLTEAEIVDVVAFLQTLSGDPVPASLGCDASPRDTDAGTHRFAACLDGGF